MKVYIDTEFRCHTDNPDGAFREVETDFFAGKCRKMIEGYCFIPNGERLVQSDGVVFEGEMYYPFRPYTKLAAAQEQYEADLAEAADAYQEGVDAAYDQ